MLIGLDTFTDIVPENNNVNDSTQIQLSNAILSELDINNSKLNDDNVYNYVEPNKQNMNNTSWQFGETVALARFNHSLEYGSSDSGGYEMEYIYIQRRLKGDNDWQTFYVKSYNGDNDIEVIVDQFIQSGLNYEYRIVPVSFLKDGDEITEILGVPSMAEEITTFGNNNFIYDQEHTYAFNYDFELGDLKTIKPTTYIQTLHSKYPIVLTNSDTEYIQGSFKCKLVTDYSINGTVNVVEEYRYRMTIKSWLSNGKPKILKTMDGTFMIINIDGEITLSPNKDILGLYDLSFNFTEIGDALNADTLQELGLIINDNDTRGEE